MSFVLQSGDFICASAMIPSRLLLQRNHGNALHGTLRRDLDRERVDDVDRLDVAEHEREERVVLAVVVEVVLHRPARRAAVPSWNLMPGRSLIVQTVLFSVPRDRLGEVRVDLAVGAGHRQRVVDRAGDLDAADRELRLVEAEPTARVGLDAVGEASAADAGAGVVRARDADGRRRAVVRVGAALLAAAPACRRDHRERGDDCNSRRSTRPATPYHGSPRFQPGPTPRRIRPMLRNSAESLTPSDCDPGHTPGV